MRLRAMQIRLLHLAHARAPAEDWELQRGTGGMSKIVDANRISQAVERRAPGSEVRSIDAIEIIQTEAGQHSAPGRGDIALGHVQRGQRRAQIRVLVSGGLANFLERRQGFGRLQVIYDGEVLIEVREN